MEFIKRREVREMIPDVSIEKLKSKENRLAANVIDSANVLYYALASVKRVEDFSPMRVKDFLQRQRLAPITELRTMSPQEAVEESDSWISLIRQEREEYYKQNPERLAQTKKYVNHRRAILGIGQVDGPIDSGLPTMQWHRETGYRKFEGRRPDENKYRVNIADDPTEDREELWSLVVQDLVKQDVVREAGFGSKVIGAVKSDGLIFYFGDRVIDIALPIIIQKMKKGNFGKGETVRFGQQVDERISGLTVTCDPRSGDTFGDCISGGLYAGLSGPISRMSREKLMKSLLDDPRNQMNLWGEISGKCEAELKRASGMSKLHPNVAFFDQTA